MNAHIDKIQILWDELAGFPSAEADTAIMHMLTSLCYMFDAKNASWSAVVRLPITTPGDLLNGWRPCFVSLLHQAPAFADSIKVQNEKQWLPEVDISSIIDAAGEEPFLTKLLSEGLPNEWFEGDYYRRHYLDVGHADHMSVRCAITKDVRIHIYIYRDLTSPRFNTEDKEPFALIVRGLKWFHRQQLLSHGLLISETPLTPTEHKVLLDILAGHSEKLIAVSQKHSINTTHAHIKSIYRKFGVTNRGMLTALWLGNLA